MAPDWASSASFPATPPADLTGPAPAKRGMLGFGKPRRTVVAGITVVALAAEGLSCMIMATPLLVGAAATACSLAGYSLIEFMLGVDAPVSFELAREIVLGTVVNTIVALPMWALVRRCLIGALPDDPRRRRRRAYTTGGLSPLQQGAARRATFTRPKPL